jgi:hypothetical protein
LPIADCRLTIAKVARQLLPMSISNRKSTFDNQQSAIGNEKMMPIEQRK